MINCLHFSTIDSTNTYLKEHYASLQHGTIVQADEQTAGRGRFTRSWISDKGGLYFSVLLKPTTTNFLPNLTQLMALSVANALKKLGLTPNLKWPNDVQVNGLKICGILSEAIASSSGISALIIGVGINVAQQSVANVGQPAISLRDLGITISNEDLLSSIFDYFWKYYEQVLENGFSVIAQSYKNSFSALGKEVTIKNENQIIKGIAKDVSDNGTLILQTDLGPQEIYIGDLIV